MKYLVKQNEVYHLIECVGFAPQGYDEILEAPQELQNVYDADILEGISEMGETYKYVVVNPDKVVARLAAEEAARMAFETAYTTLRQREYPAIQEQLDMLYWDMVNGTSNWKDLITKIKNKYSKI